MKKTLDAVIVVFLSIVIMLLVDIGWDLRALSKRTESQDIKEVVWLIPNDASCSDIWNARDLGIIVDEYELKLVDK